MFLHLLSHHWFLHFLCACVHITLYEGGGLVNIRGDFMAHFVVTAEMTTWSKLTAKDSPVTTAPWISVIQIKTYRGEGEAVHWLTVSALQLVNCLSAATQVIL